MYIFFICLIAICVFLIQFAKISITSTFISLLITDLVSSPVCSQSCGLFQKRIVASANTSFSSLELDQFSCSIDNYKTVAAVNLKHGYCTKQKTKNYAIYKYKKVHKRKSYCFCVKNTLNYLWSAKKK